MMKLLQIVVAISFLALAGIVHSRMLGPLDAKTAVAVRVASAVWIDYPMALITFLGSAEVSGVLCLVVSRMLWRRGAWSLGVLVIAGLAFSVAIELLCKSTISQPRVWPALHRNVFSLHLLHLKTRFIFPSGHTTRAMLVYGLLAMLPGGTNQFRRTGMRIALITLIVLIGLSRIYLGAHWMSDVIGGYLLGGFILSFYVPLVRDMPPPTHLHPHPSSIGTDKQ